MAGVGKPRPLVEADLERAAEIERATFPDPWSRRSFAQTLARVFGIAAVDDHHIYFVSLDNVLRSLNRISGAQQWMRPLPVRPVWGPLKVVDRLFVGGQAATLHAFDLKDGRPAGTLGAGAEVAAAPRLVSSSAPAMLPVVMVVTRDIAKGAAARLVTRRLEPETDPLTDPLPNVIKMGSAVPSRP